MKLRTAAATVVTAMFLTAGAAFAQQGQAVTDDKVQSYVVAYMNVQDIVREYKSKADEAKSDAEIEKLRSFYGNHITEAVESEDLTVDEYNSITRQLETDTELRERVTEKIIEMRQDGQ